MRNESAEAHNDPVILRNRAEAFADGYRQCFADFQAWANGQSGVPVDYITENMKENADRYLDFADSYGCHKGKG